MCIHVNNRKLGISLIPKISIVTSTILILRVTPSRKRSMGDRDTAEHKNLRIARGGRRSYQASFQTIIHEIVRENTPTGEF